jgi:selenocysteine lyase/cysteine desulfurase
MLELESHHNEAYSHLEKGIYAALETYSNIHRGTGHFSIVSTMLFDKAREIVLNYLNLDKKKYIVIFSTPRRANVFGKLTKQFKDIILSSVDLGLPLGVRAIAIKKRLLLKSNLFETGGGIVKFVTPTSAIWSDLPERFEAGTPNIVNVIAFAKALQLIKDFGNNIFKKQETKASSAKEILYQDDLLRFSGKELLLELRRTLIGREIQVPTADGSRSYINFDNGASTPTFFPMWDVFCQVLKIPNHMHLEIIKETKDICLEFLGAPKDKYDVFFTSNTTEAINIATLNFCTDFLDNHETIILNSLLEHHSNDFPWRYIPNSSMIRLSIDSEGFFRLQELERLLHEYNIDCTHANKRIRIVAISGASNVLGSFNNLKEISRITHNNGALLLVDGAQLVAHSKVNIKELNIDFFAFSAHKLYAPFGSGGLIVKRGLLRINTIALENIKASGEENVAGIAALGKAITFLQRIGMDIIEQEERELTSIALKGLNSIPNIKIYGIQDSYSPNFLQKGGVITFSLRKVPHNVVARELAEYGGIGVRNGCFCAHLLIKHLIGLKPLRLFVAKLLMMFVPTLGTVYLPGLVRVSFGLENDKNEVRYFIKILKQINSRKRILINRLLGATNSGSGFRTHPLVPKPIKNFIDTSVKRVYSLDLSIL